MRLSATSSRDGMQLCGAAFSNFAIFCFEEGFGRNVGPKSGDPSRSARTDVLGATRSQKGRFAAAGRICDFRLENPLLSRNRKETGNFEIFSYLYIRILSFVAEGILRLDPIAGCGRLASPRRAEPSKWSSVGTSPGIGPIPERRGNSGRNFTPRKALKAATEAQFQP